MRLRQEYSVGSLSMYMLTFALETPVILLRVVIATLLAGVVLAATGHSTASSGSWGELLLIPTGWSLLALMWPGGGGWWWRQRIGGREPSQREQLAYQDAIELLQDNAHEPLREPGTWFVLDAPEPDAAVVGDALMLSRGLLDSPHLPAVLAHELGHLGSPDGRVTAALNRLMIHPAIYDRDPEERDHHEHRPPPIDDDTVFIIAVAILATVWFTKKMVALLRGGLGLYILRPMWGRYWREREYTADQYAAALGQADELADFLEVHALIHDHPIPFIWLTEHTHPPTELRIDRLRTPRPRRARTARRINPMTTATTTMTTRSTHRLVLWGNARTSCSENT
jgi:Zn-dependent protease with chaperone function